MKELNNAEKARVEEIDIQLQTETDEEVIKSLEKEKEDLINGIIGIDEE